MSRYQEHTVQLTERESAVLRLVALGLSAKEAALELDIAPCTVERHVENVRLKTRTRNRAHLIAHVIREGLLPPEQSKPEFRINHREIAESYVFS
jgi:LuxR family transcriptional regulator of spore coat protein